jgi:hypothetical protein
VTVVQSGAMPKPKEPTVAEFVEELVRAGWSGQSTYFEVSGRCMWHMPPRPACGADGCMIVLVEIAGTVQPSLLCAEHGKPLIEELARRVPDLVGGGLFGTVDESPDGG